MNSNKKIASAIGAKTARACDSCVKKRARWYCAADDAFLCQSCDSSVHSANPLAQRHERVRLKTASFKPINDASSLENCTPAWHQGFTRKARTPRHAKHFKAESQPFPNPLLLVPQLGNDETSLDDNEEQLLYRVPIFDPFLAEFCETTPQVNDVTAPAISPVTNELKDISVYNGENIHGFLPSDMDLAEFAADVESLLGRGFDEDSFGMEGLGILNSKEEDTNITSITTEFCYENQKVNKDVKEEEVEAVVACQMDPELDMSRETLDLNFDYVTGEEETENKVKEGQEDMNMNMMTMMNGEYKTEEISKKVFLRLDYDAIIASWTSQGSPWTTGDRPKFNLDDCWPDFHGMCSMDVQLAYGDGGGGIGGHGAVGDGGREARVSRYREKRRTRLFSKKIRYEVRKLNAEKRPRMKGRFVKRTSFAGPGFSF